MSFEEILMNFLGARSKWFLQFEVENGRGSIAIQGGRIIFAELNYEGEIFEGKEAIERIIDIAPEIKDVELQPLEGMIEENVDLDQFAFLSLLQKQEESSVEGEDLEEKLVNSTESDIESIFGEEEEREDVVTAAASIEEDEGKLTEVCLKFFSKDAVKLIVFDGKIELNSVSIPEKEVQKAFSIYQELVRDLPDAEYLIFKTDDLMGLVIFSGEKMALILLDARERANFELDEPEIIKELKAVMQSS